VFHIEVAVPDTARMTTHMHQQSIRSALRRSGIAGPTIVAGDPGWDAARQAWNLTVDQRPLAVTFPQHTDDVVAIVEVAASLGATIVTQGTGHGAATYDSLEGSILLRTTRLQDLEIEDQRCRTGAGVLWGDVAAAAGAAGLSGLAGSSPDVGVVGYTLGGGIGWLSRRYGLASNAVRSIDLVTGDGRVERIGPHHLSDVFWALRGGGGGLGVVTGLEFDLFPVSRVLAGTLAWDARFAPQLLGAWAAWTDELDDSITSIIRFLNLPDLPGVPEPFRGRRVVTLGVAAVGSARAASAQIDVMRRTAPPILDTVDVMPAADLCRLHGDPEGPTAGLADHTLLNGMPPGLIDVLIEVAGVDSGSPLVTVEVRHLGGALAAPPADAGALSHLPAPYVLNAVGMAHDPQTRDTAAPALTATVNAVRPWSAGHYLNFVEQSIGSVFDETTTDRLAAVKASIDPAGRFRLRTGVPH
jgi:hypothetical protein